MLVSFQHFPAFPKIFTIFKTCVVAWRHPFPPPSAHCNWFYYGQWDFQLCVHWLMQNTC